MKKKFFFRKSQYRMRNFHGFHLVQYVALAFGKHHVRIRKMINFNFLMEWGLFIILLWELVYTKSVKNLSVHFKIAIYSVTHCWGSIYKLSYVS